MKGNNSHHGDNQKDNAVKGGTEKRKCFSQNNGKGNDNFKNNNHLKNK